MLCKNIEVHQEYYRGNRAFKSPQIGANESILVLFAIERNRIGFEAPFHLIHPAPTCGSYHPHSPSAKSTGTLGHGLRATWCGLTKEKWENTKCIMVQDKEKWENTGKVHHGTGRVHRGRTVTDKLLYHQALN